MATLNTRLAKLEQAAPTTSIVGASNSQLARAVGILPSDMPDFARFMRCDSTLDKAKEARFEAHLQSLAGAV